MVFLLRLRNHDYLNDFRQHSDIFNMVKKRIKPKKPYPGFPLSPCGNGQWQKKVRGKARYFGVWEDPDAALRKWLDQRDDLMAGREPRPANDERLTVLSLCDRFMASKHSKVDSKEIAIPSISNYKRTLEIVLATFGRNRTVEDLQPFDFEKLRAILAKDVKIITLRTRIQHTQTLFKYAYDERLIDKPLWLGNGFKKPEKRFILAERQADRAANGPRMFEAEEIRQILKVARPHIKTMTLLGINCAFGATDISKLPIRSINLDTGWITFPRPKTSVERRCKLWPETVEAIREYSEKRPKPIDPKNNHLAFVSKRGLPIVHLTENGMTADMLCQEFLGVLKELKMNGRRRAFYALRHTFETVGGASLDQVAVDFIMGHSDSSMAAEYRERIDNVRLEAVANHVHDWLWPKTKPVKKPTKKPSIKKK